MFKKDLNLKKVLIQYSQKSIIVSINYVNY